jgi:hypothetical protein
MAILQTTWPTLVDLTNRMDPTGSISKIAEILNQTNEIIDDVPWIEGNLPTGHQTVVRTGIPAPTWRKLYGGVLPTKSTVAKIVDTCGMMEAYGEVDKALADLNGNAAAFRFSEERPLLQGFAHEFAKQVFYSNEATNPEQFTGLAPRFNTKTVANAQSAANVIDGGGSASTNTSIWLVVWGENTVHGIYPKGSKAGLKMEDKGQVTLENAGNDSNFTGRMEAYRTHYRWDCGLTVRDWRYVVRIANIDVSQLTKDAATGADIIDLMTQALELVQDLYSGRAAFYVNRRIRGYLRRQMVAKVKSSTLTMDMVQGKMVMHLDEVPVRRCDQILNTEAQIT